MNISVFGLGYVGSVTAVCLAQMGHVIRGVDIARDKVEQLNAGRAPVGEPGLDELVAQMVHAGRLVATTDADEALRQSDVSLICVGSPGRANGAPNLDAIEQVGEQIGRAFATSCRHHLVVLRSTVLPGTTEGTLVPALRRGAGRDSWPELRVAVNPEFMREGSSLADFSTPPFTLVGCGDAAAGTLLREVYREIDAPFITTALRTAELIKYVGNAFHALKVTFANEVGTMCDALGVDVDETIRLFLMDRKLNVSEAYLRPGFAFGGPCLPKDLRALVSAAEHAQVSLPLLSAILPSNDRHIDRGVETVLATTKRRIGLVGYAYKAGTGDLRGSPVLNLAARLVEKGCEVRILDRHVSNSRSSGTDDGVMTPEKIVALLCPSVDALLAHAEVVVLTQAGEDVVAVRAAAGQRHIVIDLARGERRR